MRPPSLKRLNEAVQRAREELYRPPTPGGGPQPLLPLYALVEMHADDVLWRSVAQVRRHAPEVYDAYLGERFLAQMIVDIVADSDSAVRRAGFRGHRDCWFLDHLDGVGGCLEPRSV
jgi:hypothetical protein